MRIKLNEAQQARLKAHVGKEVFFGIRPEDLNFEKTPASENNMQLKIVNKEPLGAETHYFLQTKEQSLVARVGPDVDFQLGDVLNFTPSMDRAKFFSKETEENLCEDIEKKW